MKTTAFYNEHDPVAAAWLRELIAEGHIAPGVVDERSICEIKPEELYAYTQCHFFAGVGGWSLAFRRAGIPDNAPIWSGSCPCQPLSSAGLQCAHADERHLWPTFYSHIAECQPAIVVGEQVAGPLAREWFAGVRADLEGVGYACGGADLCAPGVGAPHIRQRIYWLAHSSGFRQQIRQERQERIPDWWAVALRRCQAGGVGNADRTGSLSRKQASPRNGHRSSALANGRARRLGHSNGLGQQSVRRAESAVSAQSGDWAIFDLIECADGKTRRIESGTLPLADGVPGRVGLLRGYGNAIVPELGAQFMSAAIEAIANTEVAGGSPAQ